MALVSSSFAERYAELTSRVPTLTESLLDVQRGEVCERREVEAHEQAGFQDVLHVAAIMISDKKALRHRSAALSDAHALTVYKQETAVWFPAAPPRSVNFRANRPLRAFPHAAFNDMLDEERELRQWLYGVERHLRQHVEEACSRSWLYLNMLDDTVSKENRGRQRLMKEADDSFVELKQRFFRTVPADYFRHVIRARYGSSLPAPPAEDTSIEAQEQRARAALCDEEVAACKDVFQYFQIAYGVRLFSLNHQEVIERYELEEAEANTLFPLIAGLCRADFGGAFYHVPALALHISSNCPSLRALCLAQLQPPSSKTDATASNSEPPSVSTTPAAAEATEVVKEVEYTQESAEDTQAVPPSAVENNEDELAPAAEETHPDVPAQGDEGEGNAREPEEEEETLAVDEDVLVVPDATGATDELPPVLFVVEEEAPRAAAEEEPAAPSLSHDGSELTCSPQPLPKSVFSRVEVFLGDPFDEEPNRKKKRKQSKRNKTSLCACGAKRSKSRENDEL
ncbi:hypothetical protein ABB37_01246 [Leptomonas pyrrhocoris]|uniref:Uncharacterized protein n=1 Tax=Leptomonas pyrrhocoris TaxID=157538 RepID=A0A0N0VGZ7_LEPPY|nr:hypothetical protein ABB37_01246 [Leptomonas pyrrhocoris]XP_015663193.1 hypothetical protein ABB37_01246 [Leptomonas pyrrhocoris]XP_015663194.1 hypothetical protein ABB37_01246 [Leptomonas pyrrhocoris]KPA84753.1 hypothetical protein ABB37_01246 [Leptomonas pyrrhocoris]KPA84754.1 hypothetical protein ABB37_01246 [Leptomonas pyrrhocoris]KPA84755.1 hypothetical protein ABB37_01246 [Leptomonas pyrrhocoris]|eukprot:XP_015663192.1 hypothetical protein ABB37_01246 [Leptomonas pyrrhocoris]